MAAGSPYRLDRADAGTSLGVKGETALHLIAQQLSPGSVTSPSLAVVFILILALGMGTNLVFSVTPALQLNPGGMPPCRPSRFV